MILADDGLLKLNENRLGFVCCGAMEDIDLAVAVAVAVVVLI